MPQARRKRYLGILVIAVLEIANASYLASFDARGAFHRFNVVLHILLGLPLAAAILFRSLPALFQAARRSGPIQATVLRLLAAVAAAFVGSGLVLVVTGSSGPYAPILKLHVTAALTGGALLLLLVWVWSRRPGADHKSRAVFFWNAIVLATALLIPLSIRACRDRPHSQVTTSSSPPAERAAALATGEGRDL